MRFIARIFSAIAALLEVGGDAVIRKGLKNRSFGMILLGFLVVGCDGMTVNLVKWDFSKLLGVYVAVFAVVSVCTGLLIFKESILLSTWLGLILIVLGGLTIQFGSR